MGRKREPERGATVVARRQKREGDARRHFAGRPLERLLTTV